MTQKECIDYYIYKDDRKKSLLDCILKCLTALKIYKLKINVLIHKINQREWKTILRLSP